MNQDTVFKTHNKSGESLLKKFVGGFIPHELFSYLTLYLVANSTSKTKLLNDILKERIKSLQFKFPEEILEKTVAEKASRTWQIVKSNTKETFEDFKTKIHKELTKKGLSESCIEKILNQIKN